MTQFGIAATGASESRAISAWPAVEMAGMRAFVTIERNGMKIKYCDKQILNAINKRAIANNYNRAIQQQFIDDLPDDVNFPITFCMVHEHAAGKSVPAHMRCRVMTGKSLLGPFVDVYVDVEMGMFDMMPEAEVENAKREPHKATVSDN
jgi:hypothetical protein